MHYQLTVIATLSTMASSVYFPVSAHNSHYDYRDVEGGFIYTEYPVCIYIPSVSVNCTKEYIADCFYNIGSIARIDIVAIKNFELRQVDTQHKRVFIHFEGLYDTVTSRYIMENISKPDVFIPFVANLYGYYEKWKLGMAKNPVPETEMNIHQIAHVMDIIDVKVLDLEDAIKEVPVTIAKNMDNIEDLHESVDFLQEDMNNIEEDVSILNNRIKELEDYRKNSERTIISLMNRMRDLEEIIMKSKIMDEICDMLDK